MSFKLVTGKNETGEKNNRMTNYHLALSSRYSILQDSHLRNVICIFFLDFNIFFSINDISMIFHEAKMM